MLAVTVAVAGMGFWLGTVAGAATVEPGSAADPLVSKSYVDQLVRDQVSEQVRQQVSQQVGDQLRNIGRFRIVTLAAGEQLVGHEGTELVIRAGEVVVAAGTGGGLADLTAGIDLGDGEAGPVNHLLLVPRSDGRGFVARTDVILLVRGSFSLQPAVQPAAT